MKESNRKKGEAYGPEYRGVPLKAVKIPAPIATRAFMNGAKAAFVRIGGEPLSPLHRFNVPFALKWTNAVTLSAFGSLYGRAFSPS